MSRYDRDYRSSRSYRNSRSTRNYRQGRRGNYEPSGGSGLSMIIILFLLAMGVYLASGEKGKVWLSDWVSKAQQAISNGIVLNSEEAPLPSNMTPCTKANIAKIVAYTLIDETNLAEEKTDNEVWYSKYYTLLKEDPKFNFFNEEEAMEVMTYEEARKFFVDILGEGYSVDVSGSKGITEKNLTLKEFLKGFEQALEHAGKKDLLRYEELSILATSLTNNRLGAWQVLTDKGVYGFEGLILDPCVGYTLQAIVKNDEILGIVNTLSTTSKLKECYVVAVEPGKATIRIDDYELTYKNKTLPEDAVGKICTITVEKDEIVAYEILKEDEGDTLIRMNDEYIELAKAGRIPYQKLNLFDGTGSNTYTKVGQLFCGMKVSYTMANDKIQTLKVLDDQVGDEVRVLLSEDGLSGYNHDEVQVTSDENYTVTYGDTTQEISGGETWDVSKMDWKMGVNKVVISPSKEGAIQLLSTKRREVSPSYKGTLEICKEEEGYTVVNKVGIEDYIAAVIPSEMPISYEKEALKAQAVAARSFTKVQQKNNKYLKYGAQLDDTVATQVYNHSPADEISYKAVNETKGEVMLFNSRVISGNFFSTSAGYTANHGETWAVGEIFPNNTPSYLVARQQYIGERQIQDLQNEKEAYKFFTTPASKIDAFDSDSPWFRWQVHMDAQELEHVVNSSIYNLTTNYPNMVKIQDGENWVTGEINNIGAIKDIQITRRGQGGNIMELIVQGEEKTIKVGTEYLVRSLFAPMQRDSSKDPIIVTRADGSEIQNMSLLPSGFFTTDIKYDEAGKISELNLYGGGYGHGVGMSQNGAQGMAKRGYTYKEILRHYYQGISIDKA